MKIWKKILIAVAALFLIGLFLDLAAGKKPDHINYGVTFSVPYARNLGLDWKQVYTAMLDDLNVKLVRIPVYWDEVEQQQGQYNFTDYDFMMQQAEAHHAQVILAVGKRLPRWPECHVPDWASKLTIADQENDQLSYMETVVQRYQSSAALNMWQVENEPFLSSFGPCPPLNVQFFDKEISYVKQLDPAHLILITDSGELSPWFKAGSRGDVFGTTYYRYIYSDVLKRYWVNFYFPTWFYRIKAGVLKLLHHGKPVILAELEAEPWTTAGITNTSIDEQFQTMSLDKFNTITSLAAKTGFSPQYLWGVEWWYWIKQKGHPEFWERAKQLIQTHQ